VKHSVEPVRYDSSVHRPFQDALRQRVMAYVRSQPNGRFGNPSMAFRVVTLLAIHWGLYAALVTQLHSLPVTALLLVAYAVSVMSVAYSVSHDAVHGALSKRRWVNELLFHGTFNLFGPNAYLWRLRHRIMHHNCVNIPGVDFNIEASDLLRFSPTQTWRPMHRFQHLYAPLLYVLFTTHWVFVKDAKMLTVKTIGNVTDIEHPWPAVLGVLAWKAVYVTLAFVVPMQLLGVGFLPVLGAYLFYQAIVSFLFVLTFTGSHLNRGLVFVPPRAADGKVPHGFYEHALRTSLDFHPTNPLVSFVFGGFNAHVAHHMFPQICSVHYPAITPIIEATAKEYGLPYQTMNMAELFVTHFRYLYDLGRGPEEPKAAYLRTGD